VLVPSNTKGDSALGTVLTFMPRHEQTAYRYICWMEPEYHYEWSEPLLTQHGIRVNCLKGKATGQPTEPVEGLTEQLQFDLDKDPIHDEALEFIKCERKLLSLAFTGFDSLFRLEMLYLLLWSSIERYLSMRYQLKGKTDDKLRLMASDTFLQGQLRNARVGERTIHRVDNPVFTRTSNTNNVYQLLLYYYQIRCNLVHHGKEGIDYDLLYQALSELLPVFKRTADHAYKESAAYGSR